jgi:hypothetical protein
MNTTHLARRVFLTALISTSTLLALAPQQALAYDPQSTSALNVDATGMALKGHDPVAYFTAGEPTLGKVEFTATHLGAIYRFASAANRDAFKAQADKYAPQFGGFCAMGVALEKKLDGDPTAWRVVDGKLYLNVSKVVQQKWLQDVPGHVKTAEGNWPNIKNKAPKDL